MEEIIAKIKAKKQSAGRGVELGVARATGFLFAESQYLVPVEYGELKDSGYMTIRGSYYKTEGEIGYKAPYAMYVHELVEMKLAGKPRPSGIGVYWGPHGQAKFLEGPIRKNSKKVKDIIKASVKEYLAK